MKSHTLLSEHQSSKKYIYISQYNKYCQHIINTIRHIGYIVLFYALAFCGVAFAVLGGGTSPIGLPQLRGAVSFADCTGRKWSGIESMTEFGSVQKNSGAAFIDHIWSPSTIPLARAEYANAYSDDTGVFWAYATHNATATGICGVSARSDFQQTFIKDTANAWMTFTVSRASLFVDRSGAWQNSGNSGGRADIEMVGHIQAEVDNWEEFEIFNEFGWIATVPGGVWSSPFYNVTGPMKFNITRDELDIKEILFDRYTGNIDISWVPVGSAFTVSFRAEAFAEGGFVAEGPMRTEAFVRDPLNSGGVVLSVDGVTPLNNSTAISVPRDRAQAQVIQGDGKIVAVGQAFVNGNFDIAIARYNSDGSLDTGFGVGGKKTTDIAGNSDMANAVAMQADGKIIVAGSAGGTSPVSAIRAASSVVTSSDFALVRYNSDGTLDTSFGTAGTGKVTLDFAGGEDSAKAVAIQGDGKIVVAGSAGSGTNQDFALARFNTDGTLDMSFNGTGKVTTDFAGAGDYAYALALQSDGKMVVAGRSDSAGVTKTDFALARYNSDGTPDTSFGSGGKVTTDFVSGSDSAQALALQSDGKIVATGWAYNGTHNDFAVARYNTDGSLDSAFGNSGKVLIDFSGTHDEANAIVIQSDGKIVIGGNTSSSLVLRDFAIVRLNADGSMDSSFGSNGRASFDFSSKDDRIAALSLQSDGKIVASGYANTATGDDFAMLRLVP